MQNNIEKKNLHFINNQQNIYILFDLRHISQQLAI